ncbi:hypothetical protein COEREDRAFT_86096 [Coemansia reversa NRRL 1564]|uniref:Uncharacterized protein n=1 Tax=Coemansia reversa (strain ATCC 12441 / NRRL 1564) TaxID=763665 RepID=A0A2G5BEQ0_COERN|nr:hypothetical protein COEREDRAFT_86096 [Coemansia reversa NRRL 1564]|eukprot:PIA17471.1 hypothetical protein COEREDRAFT_86096 [Coemansia reversa NRRL 1564]
MTSPRTFPRLRSSPNTTSDNGRPHDVRTFAFDNGFHSLPHTPRAHYGGLSLSARSIWVTMRRDRQSRIHTILEARPTKDPQSAHAIQHQHGQHGQARSRQHRRAESVIASLSSKNLPKAIRTRAREVAWMLGQRTKPRTVVMCDLANELRTTALDEDDVVTDALVAAERSGRISDGSEHSADFEAIQEIVSLRHTLRLLLRMQAEHPDGAVRENVDDILARINSAKKTTKLPIPQPLASGPSFFFPAHRFALVTQLRAGDSIEMDDDSYSSSSDEFSDYEDGDNGGSDVVSAVNAGTAQQIKAATVAASKYGLLGTDDQRNARTTHLVWARKYAECMHEQWHNGAPHLFQLFNPLPQCGFALSSTLANIFGVYRSSIKEPEANYLFAVGAAQVGCYPLVCFAESRVMSACYDDGDGDVYETWLSRGLSSASTKTQLLAHFGSLLAVRSWAITAADIQRFVNEYVHIQTNLHTPQTQSSEQQQHQAHQQRYRQRGDSNDSMALPRMSFHRSLSTSVVPGTIAHPSPPMLPGVSRKSIEEEAIRDLLHTMVVVAVAHGLGSFATACGITPDLDHPAGSFFKQMDGLMPVEIITGLSHVAPSPLPSTNAGGSQQPPQQQKNAYFSSAFTERVERNTAELLVRLQQPFSPEGDLADDDSLQPEPLSANALSLQQPLSQPPHMLSTGSCAGSCVRIPSLVLDPLQSQTPQFNAYHQMRAQRLSRYVAYASCPPSQSQSQSQSQQLAFLTSNIRYTGGEAEVTTARSDVSAPTSASPLEIAHNIEHSVPQPLQVMEMPPAKEQFYSFSQPNTAACLTSQRPQPIHLSQREDLQWDVVSSYLRQQLSILDDHLGAEVQAARTLVSRSFIETQLDTSHSDAPDVSVAGHIHTVVASNPNVPEWDHASDKMEDVRSTGAGPKSYSMTNMFAPPSGHHDTAPYTGVGSRPYRGGTASYSTDLRRFYDAVWHFTLSLFHVYEEFYFYKKFKNETTPYCSQSDDQHSGAISVPAGSSDVDSWTDVTADKEDGRQNVGQIDSTRQFSRWITNELKDHIRIMVRNPSSVSALSAQPPVAAGLNLCVEEMVHINLIVSLARRQAEIIHGIRAIREYEALSG